MICMASESVLLRRKQCLVQRLTRRFLWASMEQEKIKSLRHVRGEQELSSSYLSTILYWFLLWRRR